MVAVTRWSSPSFMWQGLRPVWGAANANAGNVLPIIREIQKTGAASLRAIADPLNARGIPTRRGCRWYAASVRYVLARA